MKHYFLSSVFILMSFGAFAQITNPQIDPIIQGTSLIIHFDNTYDSTLAKSIQDQIENFNPDKITDSHYDNANQKFFISYTSLMNRIELLAIFKDLGMTGYIIENNIKYTLNGTNTDLEENEIE